MSGLMSRLCAATVLSLLMLPVASHGKEIYVPRDWPTIQDAIDAAVNGDKIIVSPGIYPENINFLGKALTVRSEDGPDATIIDGMSEGACVKFANSEGRDSIIEGFTLTNGIGSYFSPGKSGGGVYCANSSPTVRYNVVTGNSVVAYGGGIYCGGNAGAKIYANVIKGNTAAMNGGGISLRSGRDSESVVEGNMIEGNSCDGYGGGLESLHNTAYVLDNEFQGNVALKGGGVYVYDASIFFEQNEVVGNMAVETGGGMEGYSNAVVEARRNSFRRNRAESGGGAYFGQDAVPLLVNNIFVDNAATNGGGVEFWRGSNGLFTNNLVMGNFAQGEGGGICCIESCFVTVTNTILWGNLAASGEEVYVGNAASFSVVNIGFSVVEGGLASVKVEPNCKVNWNANLEVNPALCDSANGDFHLTYGSPCINAGDNRGPGLGETDFEGDDRIRDQIVDIGPDEFSEHLYHVGDVVPGGTIEIKVVGEPGQHVWLALGSGTVNPPQATAYGYLYIPWPPVWLSSLGSVPSTGILVEQTTVPVFWVPDDQKPFQALVGSIGGSTTRLTNLMVLEVE